MARRELRIVSANFGASPLRLHQVVEIVNRDDLRGASGRNEERMRRMHDVDIACEHLDIRPLGTVPQVVQDGNRHTSVDKSGAKFVCNRW